MGKDDKPQAKQSTRQPADEKVDAKTALLTAAKKVFADRGYDGATVKDLADEAGVNISLVSYYYGGKEGLFKACVQNFADERFDAIERILKAPGNPDEMRVRLRMFGEEMMQVHLREPDLCKIIHSGMEMQTKMATEAFTGGFLRVYYCFISFLQAAEKSKIIRKFKDYEPVAMLAFGSLMHVLRTEQLRVFLKKPSIREPKFQEEVLSLWVDLTMNALALSPPKKD